MRQAGPQASDPMHYAPAAAFVMHNADAHIDTIHQLLVGAIEGGNHGYDATDAALVNAMWGLAMVSWLGGRAELWEPFLAMMQLKVAEDRAGRFFGWYFRYVQALLAAVQGRFDTSRALANQVIGWAGPRGVGLAQVWAHYALELADLGAGDFEGAYRHATAMSPAGTLAPYAPHCLWAVMDLVESAVRTHRQAEAERHVHAISEAGIAALSPRLAILAAGSAALVAGDDQAPALFEEALGLPAADQWPFDVARVRLVYGEQLRRLRATSESRIHLEAALAAFQKLGALPWASRAELELRATGRTRMPSRAPDAGALTPQELQIARLAASGMTNKQIAERLFLSPRTVGGHLYQIFPKLGSRPELASATPWTRSAAPPYRGSVAVAVALFLVLPVGLAILGSVFAHLGPVLIDVQPAFQLLGAALFLGRLVPFSLLLAQGLEFGLQGLIPRPGRIVRVTHAGSS
jgi:DNA-binding CsgD family transcriptional regulator